MIDRGKKIIAEEFLDYDSISELTAKINTVSDSEVLHLILLNYNWDDGLEIPQAIMENTYCELSTALEMFYLAEGLDYLENKDECDFADDTEWLSFVEKLYSGIMQGKFTKGSIEFTPPLSKVQIFKLKKIIKDDEMVFIQSIINQV